MKKFLLVVLLFFVANIFLFGCGLRLKEKPEELDKMTIPELYNLGVKYYSDGMISEAKFVYTKIVDKYKTLPNPTDEDRDKYYWALYEIGFINYKNEDYKEALAFIDRVISGTSDGLTDKSPQVILAKKVRLKILPYLR